MKRLIVDIELREDAVISECSASEGGHQSLDYIPGAKLLGIAASSLYNSVDRDLQFLLFHSGHVSFGNGYCVSSSDKAGLPIPSAWHKFKVEDEGKAFKEQGGQIQLNPEFLINPCYQDIEGLPQLQQIREGYVTEALEILKPSRGFRMKTAINPQTARAANSQLFGYEALQTGQRFRSEILIGEKVDTDTIEKLTDALSGTAFLGRSRTAQYGKAELRVSQCDISTADFASEQDNLTLWLLADMALSNKHGHYARFNEIKVPGLIGDILWEKSFLRFRSYSPYNSYRKCFDSERQVIQKGSVITIALGAPLDEQTMTQLMQGVGCYRECGLGRVAVNHEFLGEGLCLLKSGQDVEATNRQDQATEVQVEIVSRQDKNNDQLIRWLSERVKREGTKSNVAEKVAEAIKALQQFYANAQSYKGEQADVVVGPSATQWARVENEAKKKYSDNELMKKLFSNETQKQQDYESNKLHSVICDREDDAWKTMSFNANHDLQSFADWFKELLDNQKNLSEFTVNFARHAQKCVKQIEKGGH